MDLTPFEHAHLLEQLAQHDGFGPDSYSCGGVVEKLERAFAAELGKPCAVFIPTGTLANHLALRRLCAQTGGRKVVVQAESHIFRDSGDCAQELSGLHLLPLAAGETTFTAKAFQEQLQRAASGRVATRIGAVSIESLVRRSNNQRFDYAEMQRVVTVAREHGIGTHLDGARLHIESAFTGVPVAEQAALFDTVYVSLYKSFHSGSGAILAGPVELLEGLYHERRMFGGGIPQVWQYAAIAHSFLPGTIERLQQAIVRADELFAALDAREDWTIERLVGGTNVVLLHVSGGDAVALRERALARGVVLPVPSASGTFHLKINESLLRADVAQVLAAFTN